MRAERVPEYLVLHDGYSGTASPRLRDPQPTRALLGAVYPVATLLVVLPLFDLASTAWPVQVGNLQWRYGFLGLLSNFIVTPMLGATAAAFAAAELRHRRVLQTLAVLFLISALVLGGAGAAFVLDAIQLRAQLANQIIPNFRTTVLLACVKYLVGGLGLVGLAFGAWRTARAARSVSPRPRDPATVVGGSR